MTQKVTPWDVQGEVNYDKIVKEFGVSKLDVKTLNRLKKHTGKVHFMLERKIFFAHRDLNWILDECEKGNKFFLYTGCGPSGPIHLGHIGTWMFTKWLQEVFDVELWFQFTDDEKFLFKKDKSMEDIQHWMHENMLDIIALGFDPKKTHFIIDTKHANLLYPIAIEVAKKLNFSTVKAAFGLTNDRNVGEIFFTAMQAAPAALPSVLANKNIPCLIPHAIDQDPHFRITRDIMPKINRYKPASIQNMFLPPLTGSQGKMSSSAENSAITTTDTPKEVERKIKRYAFSGGRETMEEHRKYGGNPDIDVSYQYLRMLLEEDDEKLKEIYDQYKAGKMTTAELKSYTIDKINTFLQDHQKKREAAKKQLDKFIYKG